MIFFGKDCARFSRKSWRNLEKLTLLNAFIGNLHGEMVLQCLEKWQVKTASVDLIASHGQTIYHAPKRL